MTATTLLMTVYSDPKSGRLTGKVTGAIPRFLEDVCGLPVRLGGFKAIVDDWQRLDDNDVVEAIAHAFDRRGGTFRKTLREMLEANLKATPRKVYREVVLEAAKTVLKTATNALESEAKGLEEAAAKAVSVAPVQPEAGATSAPEGDAPTEAQQGAKAPEKPKKDPAQLRRRAAELTEAVERACNRRPRSREIRRRGWLNGFTIAMEMFRYPNGNVGGHIVGTNGPLSSSAHREVKGSSWYGVLFEVEPQSGRVLRMEERDLRWYAAMVPDRRNRETKKVRKPFLVVDAAAIKPGMVVPHTEPLGNDGTSVRFLFTGMKGVKANEGTGYPMYSASVPDLASLFADGNVLASHDENDRREVKIGGVVLGVVRRQATEDEKKRGRYHFVEVSGEMYRSMDGTGGFNELVCFARDPEGTHWDMQMFRKGATGAATVIDDDDDAAGEGEGADATAAAK